MSRFTNAVVIGLLLFLGLLAAFWYATEVRSDEGVEITSRSAQWVEGSSGRSLDVRLLLENPRRTDADVQSVTYHVSYGNATSGEVTKPLRAIVPPGKALNITFKVELPGFPADWWETYQASGEDGSVKVEGHVTLLQSVRKHEVPFQWESTWRGDYSSDLQDILDGCPADNGSLCLSSAEADWEDGDLSLILALQNDGDRSLELTKVEAELQFGSTVVATGGGEGELRIGAGDKEELEVVLSFDPTGITAWWPGHVTSCEESATSLHLTLTVRAAAVTSPDGNTTAGEPQTFSWNFDGPTVRTMVACRQG